MVAIEGGLFDRANCRLNLTQGPRVLHVGVAKILQVCSWAVPSALGGAHKLRGASLSTVIPPGRR